MKYTPNEYTGKSLMMGKKKMMYGGMNRQKKMYGSKAKMMKGGKAKMMYGGMMKPKKKEMMGGGMAMDRKPMRMGGYSSIHEMERDCAMKTSVRNNAKGYGSKVTIKVTT